MKKDLLKLLDLTRADITKLLNVGDQMKYNQKHGLTHNYLQGKTLAMIFDSPSIHTRVSFETGLYQLGGHAVFLSNQDRQGEPVEDTARVLSRYCDGVLICARDHREAEELARYATVPVLNGRTDFANPCQVLADLMTIRERLSRLEGLKLCLIGSGGNQVNSLIVGGLKCGMAVSVACPEGYDPDQQVLDFAAAPGAKFSLTRNPKEAVENADVVFTGLWASQSATFRDYQVNDALMELARPNCMVQHCLPARRGEEITAAVFEAHADEIFDEAENKLHIQKAILMLLMGEDL